MTVYGGDFINSNVYYLTNTKKYEGSFLNMYGERHQNYKNNIEKFSNTANFFVSRLLKNDIVYIEDYSLGSHGLTFDIAENCAILKYEMYKTGIDFKVISPKTIKKFATGNGNADKVKMFESFLKDTNFNLRKFFDCEKNLLSSPITDIVDSYYIGKYCHDLG